MSQKQEFQWREAYRTIHEFGLLLLEIEKLEQQKSKLRKAIKKDQYTIDQLENLDSLERFAREHYGHKKDNETLFLIDTDSIK